MLSSVTLMVVGLALANAQFPAAAPAAVNPYQNTIVSSIQQDSIGNFGYATADGQSRQQVVAPDGSVRGSYSHYDANGKLVTVNYVADKFGYRALGDNVPAHAQHIPPPEKPTPAPHTYTAPAPQTYNAPAPVAPVAPPAFPAPAPAVPSFPYPYAFGAPTPAPAYAHQPTPAHYRNPIAEAQLVNTVSQHAHNDARAQAAQLQQLDAITKQNPAFNPVVGHHYAHPYAG